MNLPRVTARLSDGFSVFEAALQRLVMEWAPEPVPTTIAMEKLAWILVRSHDTDLGTEETAEIFRRIEQVLEDGDDAEKDAVSTGFLEALIAALDAHPERRSILRHAGPGAWEYLEAWNQFSGRSSS